MDDQTMPVFHGTRGPVEWRLHILRIAMEMGACRTVRTFMRRWGAEVGAAAVKVRRDEYAWLIAKAGRMFEIEQVHGEGSLLELDHPLVISLIECPTPSFSNDEIEAAKKYRAIQIKS